MRPALAVLWLLSLPRAAAAQPDAGRADAWPSVAEFEGRDPFEHEVSEASALLEAPGGPDPMAVLADDDPALAAPPTEDELLEPPVRVRRGAVLEAIPGVREAEHGLAVTLAHGLALVEETLRFVASGRHRAELLYRLAIPSGARLVALSVCNDVGCREGRLDTGDGAGAYDDALVVRRAAPSGLPVAHAAIDADDPERVLLRAAPVTARDGLTVRLRWVAATPVHGGSARLAVPGAGGDPRLAPRRLEVSAVDVVAPSVDGLPLEGASVLDPGVPFELSALVPRGAAIDRLELVTAPCARGTCMRARALGPRVAAETARLAIALDVSPSTVAEARGRMIDALRVLLGVLPESAQVTLLAFAGRSVAIEGPSAPSAIELEPLRVRLEEELGTATRPDRLLDALAAEGRLERGTHVVLLGDGGLSEAPDDEAGWARAEASGAVVSAVNLSERPVARALRARVERSGGQVIEAGGEARRAASGRGDEPLAERLTALLSRAGRAVTLGGETRGMLRDGEEVVITGPLPARATLLAGDVRARPVALEGPLAEALAALADDRRALVAVAADDLRAEAGSCAPDGSRRGRPRDVESALLGPGRARIALAHRRSCETTVSARDAAAEPERALPPRALLDQLRRRVVPVARGCFRDDRRGRTDYSTRATIHAVLSDRELSEVRVEGAISDTLATCIAGAFAGLDVPRFDGTLELRWGLYTEAEPPPPTMHLSPDLSRAVDRIGAPGETTPEALLGE
jgi:hypothetical protein